MFKDKCVGILSTKAYDFIEHHKQELLESTYKDVPMPRLTTARATTARTRAPPEYDDDDEGAPPPVSHAKATRMRHREDTSGADIVDVTEAPASASAAAAAAEAASAAPTAHAKKRRT